MDTKLTLKLDKNVIGKAKEYASSHKRSLSAIIESYLQSLTGIGEAENIEEIEITPFVRVCHQDQNCHLILMTKRISV